MARKTRKPNGLTVTRKYETGYVISIKFPKSLMGDNVCYVGAKRVSYDPSLGIIGRPESRKTDYYLSNLMDAHIYTDRVDVEREFSLVSSFLKDQRNLSHGKASIENVRWLPREVLSTNRPLLAVKKYPAKPNPKLRVRRAGLVRVRVKKPSLKTLTALANEARERPSQIINP